MTIDDVNQRAAVQQRLSGAILDSVLYLRRASAKYSDDQPRDERGRFGSGTYLRYGSPSSPMSDYGHAMFASAETRPNHLEGSREKGLADYSFTHDPNDQAVIKSEDLKDKVTDTLKDWKENGVPPSASSYLSSDTIDEIESGDDSYFSAVADSFSPKDIVDSAGGFDNGDWNSFLYNEILEPNGWTVVITPDGAVVYDESKIDKLSNGKSIKSFGAIKSASSYGDELSGLVESLILGRISKGEFRSSLKALIRDEARSVAEDAFGDADEISPDDLQFVNEFINGQRGFVNEFSDWLKDKESDLDQAAGRVALWVGSLENFEEQMAARASGNPRLRFVKGDSKEACDTCTELDGQVHTLKYWQGDNPEGVDYTARNGNEIFDCGRWKDACKCYFENVKTGEVVIS